MGYLHPFWWRDTRVNYHIGVFGKIIFTFFYLLKSCCPRKYLFDFYANLQSVLHLYTDCRRKFPKCTPNGPQAFHCNFSVQMSWCFNLEKIKINNAQCICLWNRLNVLLGDFQITNTILHYSTAWYDLRFTVCYFRIDSEKLVRKSFKN